MDVEVEKPHVHHSLGHRKLDLVLPVAALFVSLVSILIAYHHGHIMKELVDQNARLVAANSLPHVTLSASSGADDSGVQHFRLSAENGGVGPAEIRTAEVSLNGRPVRNSRELLRRCCNIASPEYRFADLVNSMLQPGQKLDYLWVNSRPDPNLTRGLPALYRAITSGAIQARVCYCSVFGECWTRSSMAASRPTKVDECVAPAVPYTH